MTLEATWPQRDAVDPAWAERSACIGQTEVMYGIVGNRRDGVSWRQARALCASCPVRSECLSHAIEQNEWDGMWGGLTPSEREPMRRRPVVLCAVCESVIPHGSRNRKVCADPECQRIRHCWHSQMTHRRSVAS